MSSGDAPTLLLGLGNDILRDDAVGLVAARLLRGEFQDEVEIVESAGAGLELLDLLEGHKRALLLDAVLTGEHPPGTELEFSREHFQIREGLSASVERALPLFVGRAKQILSMWGNQRRSLDPTSSPLTLAPACEASWALSRSHSVKGLQRVCSGGDYSRVES